MVNLSTGAAVRVVGIDPGLDGGLALVDASGALLDVRRMPTYKKRLVSGKVRRLEDAVVLATCLRAWKPTHVWIEDVNGFGMGLTSSFSFGRGVGTLHGVVGGVLGLRPTLVDPQTWKGSWGILSPKRPGETKKQHQVVLKQLAIVKAHKLFPLAAGAFGHDGCAEAALIAAWGVTFAPTPTPTPTSV